MAANSSLHKTLEEFTQEGKSLLSQGRSKELLKNFEYKFKPNSWPKLPPQLMFSIGEIAIQNNSWQLAANVLRQLHKNDSKTPALSLPFSEALIQLGLLKEAEAVLQASLNSYPYDPSLLTNLANTKSELGDYRQAELLYRQVIASRPHEFLGNYNLAGFLAILGREEEALQYYKTCLQIVPNAPEALQRLKQLELRKKTQTEESGNTNNLQDIYQAIENLEWETAESKLDSCKSDLDLVRWHSAVLELPESYQNRISDKNLYNPKIQVQCKDLFDTNDPLLNELANDIKQDPSLVWNRAGKPTRLGSQSHEILASRGRSPAIDELIDRLTVTIQSFDKEYLESLTGAWAKPFKLSGWAVVLTKGGHQKRHIHPEARLSGVFYVKIPNAPEKPTHGDCGDLCFFGAQNQKALILTPKDGMAVFFPSFLPHCTIPLSNDSERICIAFNVE